MHVKCLTKRDIDLQPNLLLVAILLPSHTGSAVSVANVDAPPLPTGSSYGELVEASPGEGLHFNRGGQSVWFGDSPQVGHCLC